MAKIHSELLDYDPYNPLPLSKDQDLEIRQRVNSSFIAKTPESYVRTSLYMLLRERGLDVIFKVICFSVTLF